MVRKPDPEKRAKFMAAAMKLFVANGVQNTSTAAIAKQAGTAAGTLFLYFPTKQDLIHALVLELGKAASDYTKAHIDPELPVREIFLAIWNSSLGWFIENMDAFHYLQQVRNSGLIDEAVAQESGQFYDYYYLAIQKGHQQGAIKDYSLDVIGELLYQDIVAVMNLISNPGGAAWQEQYIRQGFDIFWDGIKAG